jgi:cytochrome c-type biogenesis protein CcmH/NrfG
MPFTQGENVGPYRIVQQLGQGGMATVFKAYHASLDRYVAIKVLHPAFTAEPSFLARFEREAKVVARLEHPNIVPVYDFAEHEGKPYLVMKFIPGETLKARLARSPLGVEEGLAIVDSVGRALAYAHQRGVLHRDIKPSNVLLSEDETIYLADFGLARIAAAGESTLSSDMVLGTPQYISPEQAKGNRDLDAGTDIYSFGVVLYEMVVGRVPFNADTPFSIIHDHIFTPLPLPSSINPLVPESVERVLLKALAKEPSDRFTTVAEMSAAFRAAVEVEPAAPVNADQALTELGTVGTPVQQAARLEDTLVPVGQEKDRRGQRKKWLMFGVPLLLVTGCLCLGVLSRLPQDGRSEPPPAAAALPSEAPMVEDRIRQAREAVSVDPDNPEVRLALAETLVESDQPGMAALEFLEAGNQLLSRGDHVGAAYAYLRALALSGGEARIDPAVRARADQACFLAAADPRIFPLLEEARSLRRDWPRLQTIEARARLHNGELEVAQVLSTEALSREPDEPMARAVQVEILMRSGSQDEARLLAQEIMRSGDVSPWLVEHLRNVLASMESP